ncbi:AAA domain-containing protein [Mumia flava]|uniref:Nuclease SbcCD subunit C n=1 Tax=Mumia flava TaxID=1348852 RepID=A0A0B2BNE0_9ACTN|nr:AAA family ATPase [Mumia flava]PJJ53753.1 AAA domain-containing protein [Mumia flava]
MDDLNTWLNARLDPDDSISDDAKLLALAAVEGDDALASVTPEDPPPSLAQTNSEPSADETAEATGAYLTSIAVQGFRGIGERATLQLHPGPGLTIVSGRNGSGKSSFAEALEVALTGDTYRWKNRPAHWGSAWRNLHADVAAEVEVALCEEEVGKTVVRVTWPDGADVDDATTTLQRHGQKREAGIESLGWGGPIETYRPLLSYEELGTVLGSKPSALHDALSTVLGLEQMTDALDRLNERRKRLEAPKKKLDAEKRSLRADLDALDDERAKQADLLLAKRKLDANALRAIATGTSTPDGTAERLRALLAIAAPDANDVDAAASELSAALAAMTSVGDDATTALERRVTIIERALDLHQHDGDQPCPVCGVGTLDGAWAAQARADVAADRQQVALLKAARARLTAARESARALVAPVPSALAGSTPDVLDEAVGSVRSAWTRWSAAPATDADLVTHLRTALAPVTEALPPMRAAASEVLAERDDAWSAIAARLAAYANDADAWSAAEPEAELTKQAHTWLKKNDLDLRNERLAPIAAQAARIWHDLRQESNVELQGFEIAGTSTRRRVEIQGAVDGEDTGALAVMSQGELHALALAIFLPRATMPQSPFRFVVLDDPVQAMDPAKVDGLVATLSRIAQDRQVVVFSHDDRLAAAVRRAPVPAQIVEVTRYESSRVEVANTYDPAGRYLRDAFALLKDTGLPDTTMRRALPGLLRMATETAARDRYWTTRLAAGDAHDVVEAAWADARLTRDRVSLSLYGDVRSLDGWLSKRGYRRRGLGVCTSALHEGLRGQPREACEDVQNLIDDLKRGAL